MDTHLLEKLQFDHVRNALASFCATRLGQELSRRIEPARKRDVVRRWFAQVRQMQEAQGSAGLPPLGGVTDIRPLMKQAGTPAGLDSEQLHQVAATLRATESLARWRDQLPESCDLIHRVAERVMDYGPFARQIDLAIDDRGQVRDNASEKLARIRGLIRQSHEALENIFQKLLKQPRVLRFLQYPGATFHDDRRVLPVKAEQRGQFRGIIHRSSDSGATVFLEPQEAVTVNNTIISLRDDERKEINRILSELSTVVHKNDHGIRSTLDSVAVLDLIAGKVRYADERNLVCPDISEDRKLWLHNARHPVLEDLFRESETLPIREVVPIDVRLGDDFDLLVITGPNTGGKTVAVKTVGLLVLMAQSGVPIPATAGSRVPIYRHVYIDVGDEQSIEQSLSTFSSHLSNILHMLQHANDQTLILLDELGAGTDPDEGAAIGRTIVDELLRIKCCAVVTTHLSVLKSIAFTESRVDNASVEFDAESLKPTYHLRIGEPGNSNALAIARRLGMPRRMVDAARSHLGQRSKALRSAIAGTLESRREAERARLSASKALLAYERERIHFEKERERLHQQRQAHEQWIEWVNRLTPGDEVYVRKFDRCARVERVHLHKQTALVSAGSMEMEVALGELASKDAASM